MARLVHWNCFGLRSKRLETDEFLRSLKVKILVANETKLDPSWLFDLKNFKRVGINNSSSHAWGTAIFVHHTVSMKVVYLHSAPAFEAILIRCTLAGQTRDIIGTYWPGSYAGDIADWRKIFRMVKHPLIFAGDLNAHHTGLLDSPSTDGRGRLLETLMDEYNLVMMSQGVTYARPHQAGNALDVALVSASLVGEASWKGYTDSLGSDHIPGILDLGLTQRVEATSRVDWGRFRGAMDNAMKGESGLAGAGVRDLEAAVGNFVSQTQLAVKCSTVRVTPRTRVHVPYWSVACQKQTNARKSAFRRWQCVRSPESYLAYKLANAQCRRFLREARRLQMEKLCQSLNEHCSPRLAWALVRGLAGMGSVSCVDSSHHFMDHGATAALRLAEQHFTLLYTSRSGLSATDVALPAGGGEGPSHLGGPFLMSELASALYRR